MNVKIRNKFIEIKYSVSSRLVLLRRLFYCFDGPRQAVSAYKKGSVTVS